MNDSGTVAKNWQRPKGGATRPGFLYRYWSTSGTLLYIGISVNAAARLSQHSGKPWFDRLAKVTVEKFETYAEAEEAELRAICYEGPIHNVRGPRDAKDIGPALARLRAAQRKANAGGASKRSPLFDRYECDVAFGCVDPAMSFEEYAALPRSRRGR
jgi:predicted GIY-YIG superfamily endonuclease